MDSVGFMRIGLDYFPATTHAPGVGRYARELTRALVPMMEPRELHLFEVGRGPQAMGEESLGLGPATRRLRVPVPARLLPSLERIGFGADRLLGGVDVFHHVRLHGPPVTRAKQSYAISEWPSAEHESTFLQRLEDFEGLFVFCEAYRKRVLGRCDRPAESVCLVPVGADHWLRDLRVQRARRPEKGPLAKPEPPRILVLGAPQAHRQHALILSACELLHRGGWEHRLLFAGSTHQDPLDLRKRLQQSPLGSRVEWRAPQEHEMPELVASSALLIHLCTDPGTAVTPMESLVLGTPVLVSAAAAFREALGEDANYFEGAGAEELASDIEAALGSLPARERLDELSRKHSWSANASRSLQAWRDWS